MARAVLSGVAASPGVGIGRVLVVADRPPGEPAAVAGPADSTPMDAAREVERLRAAFEASATELEELAARTAPVTGEEVAAIFEAQAVLARDPALLKPALAAVAAGATAAEAVLAVTPAQAEKLAALADPVFSARAADILDVGRRIAARLVGRPRAGLWHADGTPAVIIAADLAPSETATLREDRVAGIALADGALTGHAAIVARALGLPLVLELGAAVLGLAPGSVVAVDGSRGRVLLDPDAAEIQALMVVRASAHT
jgi:multiphosphoryl transfer protein